MGVNKSIQRTAVTNSWVAPIGGWNARDALGAMEITDAVTLQNFFPGPSDVMVRKGMTEYATGMPAIVESLLTYNSPTGSQFFAASGGSFYDVSSAGAVGAPDVTGLSNSQWYYVNVSTPGGSFIECCNGLDPIQLYDGTTWYSVTAISSPFAITGVDTSDIIQINLFKNRIFLIEKNSLTAWYLPINSVSGAASPLNFQSIARHGGYLVAMGTWTVDGGYGMDDNAVFITSEGEIIVYRGTDPNQASTWALAGVWYIGAPIGRRCFYKWGGDLLLLTYDGIYPLTAALQSDTIDPTVAISNKIYTAISNAISSYANNYGWCMLYYAKSNMLIINVPVALQQQQQYVMNTITKSWCNFTNWYANCWELYGSEPYFGDNGKVYRAWNGYSDANTNINALAQQAFNYFGTPGTLKRFTMARPILATTGIPAASLTVNVDFNTDITYSPLDFVDIQYGVWDTALWDTALWSGALTISKDWYGISGIGYCCSANLQVASQTIETHWISTDLVAETGSVI